MREPLRFAARASIALVLLAVACDGPAPADPDAELPRDAGSDAAPEMDGGPPSTRPDAGACVGDAADLDCSALDGPCTIGACDPATGTCIAIALDDLPCDDGDGCTVEDTCVEGACEGRTLDCTPFATACAPSACDPEAGACVPSPMPEGSACDDGTACTTASECRSGACVATAVLDCTSLEDDCNAGSCDPAIGCVAAPLTGAPCDDGDGCTTGDTCGATGSCDGAAIDCTALAGPCRAAACDPAASSCVVVNVADGVGCDDGNACTTGDACDGGVCAGGAPVACAGADACHAASCDPVTGCALTTLADGTACNDGNACTTGDACTAGSCGGAAVDCAALADPCNTAACSPTTGACVRTPRPAGTTCDTDPDDCTTDACVAGVCTRSDRTECAACGGPGSGLMCRSGVCDAEELAEREGFEGASLPAAFTASGTGAWAPSTAMSVEGTRSLRSPALAHGQSATITRTVFAAGYAEVSFAFRVSTEAADATQTGDALVLAVDGAEVRRWTGVLPWGRHSQSLPEGVHTVSWTFVKDAAGVGGEDRVHLDDLVITGVPQTIEGFESGTLASLGFTTGGASPFTIVAGGARGASSARSGTVGHGQSAFLRRTFTTTRWSRVGFAIRVSTEEVADPVEVLYDGVPVFTFYGEDPWEHWGYEVGPGTHTIEWRYTRDASGGAGSNAVWVDDFFVAPGGC